MKNILIIQTAFLGDLILTTPLIKLVKKRNPGSNIYILVNAGTEEILKNNPNIHEILILDKKKIKKSIFGFYLFIQYIRKFNFDITICPHFSYRTSLISYLSGAKIRIGYSNSGFSFLYTKKIKRPILGFHEVWKQKALIENIEPKNIEVSLPEIYFSNIEEKIFSEKYKQEISEPYIVIAPSSIWETKRFPIEKFQELVTKLIPLLNLKIIIIGSKSDVPLCEMLNVHSNIINLAGKTSLLELAFIIQKAKLVISNDSSPVHFASSFNVPIIVILGATISEFGYGPLSNIKFISEVNNLNCRPCGIHGGKQCPEKHFKCMLNQDINQIIIQTKKIWESNIE